MGRLLSGILRALGLNLGAKAPILSPGEFTREYRDVLARAASDLKVEVVKDLELRVTTANGRESTSFLDNAYHVYRRDPSRKDDVMAGFAAAGVETARTCETPVDRTQIVPVVKDRGWAKEMRAAMLNRGAKEFSDPLSEELCAELVVVYAEDAPKNVRYITAEMLAEAKVSPSELRVLATANLRRILPPIERLGGDGIFLFRAGGFYEASLLLLDPIWAGLRAEVQGEVVVAVPTRDVLLATGSENAEGVRKVRASAREAWTAGAYRLTPKLFVYRAGKFEEFDAGG